MKKIIITTLFSCLLTAFSFAQTKSSFITIILKNGSFYPKKCTVISYTPGDGGNGTQAYWLLPAGTKKLQFKEGTKIYLANKSQINFVMGGKRIDTNMPFLIVKKDDNNKSFKF